MPKAIPRPSYKPRSQEQLFKELMRLDEEYIHRPNVRTLAAFNAVAWIGGYCTGKHDIHAKKRVVLHVGVKGKSNSYVPRQAN